MDRLRALARGFLGLALATYVLIVLGALVRAHGAGLACPDWPLCFGELIPAFDLKVAFEWSHRALAGSVSIGLLVLSLLALRAQALRRWILPRLVTAWLLLAIQIVLGGLTVLLGLAPWTVTAHLLTGNAFCLTALWTACDLFERASPSARSGPSTSMALWTGIVAAVLVLQLALGGMVSSHSAGLSCASFPTCDGSSFAPTLRGLVGLHVLHRLGAVAALAGFAVLSWYARRSGRLGALAWSGLRLVVVQIVLGVANVLLRLPIELTALHSAVAAALVLITGLVVREVIYAYQAVSISTGREEELVS